MKYPSGYPYFFDKDINYILKEYKKILKGKGSLRMGRFVNEFEKNFANYLGVKKAISTTSCTTALETVFNVLKIKKNDEIIIPCQTYIASISSILRSDAKPVVAEIDKDYNLDFNDMKKKITKKTKAVVLVHFGGNISQNVLLIKKYLSKKNIFFIEDAAHALGSSLFNKKAGSFGDISVFSFYSTKMITSGEGGMIVTNNSTLANKCLKFRSRGLNLNTKKEIYDSLGTNYKVTEFQGLLGLVQLKSLDKFVTHRNSIAFTYNNTLKNLEKNNILFLPKIEKRIINSFWRYIVILNESLNRRKIIMYLKKYSIDVIHSYEPLIHQQIIYKNYLKDNNKKLNFSENYCKRHIMLPIHYNIKKKDAIFIAKTLIKAVEYNKS